MINLTIDARLINSSGIGVYLQNILKSDLLKNFRLRLPYRREDISFFENIEAELIPYDAKLYSLKETARTPLKTIGSDIFWSPHYNVPVLNFASKLKVVTIHDVYHLVYYHTLSTSQKLYAKLMFKRAVKSDLIFTVSEHSKKEIIKYTSCDPQKIHVVYNGIDFQRFNKQLSEVYVYDVLQKYHIKTPYLLFVGNVKPHKNLKTALLGFKAFFNVNFNNKESYTFVIVGRKEGFITADKEIDNLLAEDFFKDKVQFTGWISQDELPVLYKEASVFIFPSFYEGFGFPALEAMAAGCPVISSDAACLPEVYEKAALYFNPNSAVQIAEALCRVTEDEELRQDLIDSGFEQAGKYVWDKSIGQKVQLITSHIDN